MSWTVLFEYFVELRKWDAWWEVVVWFQMMIGLKSIYLELIMCLSKDWDIFGLFRKFKYEVIEWCIDMLNDVCNEVQVWSRRSIFRKGNIMLRLLLGCIDLWVSCECEWDDPNSTDIMESHRWSYSVGESRRRSIWLSLRFERTDQSISNGFTLSYGMMRYWDNYVHGCVDFTVSIMTGAGLWMLISIHEFYGSRVKCLSMWVIEIWQE